MKSTIKQQWIPTYSDYIRDYIRDYPGRYVPGEHHFVSLYLVPRLISFGFLGLPSYINPDGMKAIPGDVVFYTQDENNQSHSFAYQLGIEVKIGSVKFSSTEYNKWMRPTIEESEKPHLFVGISKDGILVGRWNSFSERYRKVAYSNEGILGTDPLPSKQYTPSRGLHKIAFDTEKVIPEEERLLPSDMMWRGYTENASEAQGNEQEILNFLYDECELLNSESNAKNSETVIIGRN